MDSTNFRLMSGGRAGQWVTARFKYTAVRFINNRRYKQLNVLASRTIDGYSNDPTSHAPELRFKGTIEEVLEAEKINRERC